MKIEKIAELLGISVEKVGKAIQNIPDLNEIITTEQAKCEYKKYSPDSASARLIMEKWLSLCTNFAQAEEAYMQAQEFAPCNNESERPAMEKLLTFCTTSQQIKFAYDIASGESEARVLAIKKLAEMPDEE